VSSSDALRAVDELVTGKGRQLLDLLADLPEADVRSFRLGAELRKQYPADLVASALTQHGLRLAAETKFERAAQMFFTRAGLEQASSEVIARHRVQRYESVGALADLCCGIGGDLVTLAAGHPVMGVDLDPVHLRMAELNAQEHGVISAVHTVRADVRDVDLTEADAIFIDPARRASGRRLQLGTSDPPLEWCLGLADQVPAVGVKAAPGISHDVIPFGWEAEFIAIGRDLKEAVLWSPALAEVPRRATILPDGHTIVAADSGSGVSSVAVRPPGQYLLDPNPAVTRAGAVQDLARQLDAWKIDDQIAFLSADHPLVTPFGRSLAVLESLPWKEKDVRAALRHLGAGRIDIRRRGLAGDVDQIRSRLNFEGSRAVLVVMTRVADRPWCLICEDVATSGR
jgi:hypothetical protein